MKSHDGDDLIIERPDLQSWPLVLGSRLITAAMWGLYVYLWLPLLTLVAWVLGLDIAYTQMVTLGGFQTALDLWLLFTSVIVIMGGALLGWARVNFYRFRGADRRQAPALTDEIRMAIDFGLAPDQRSPLHYCRRARLDHDPDGSLRSVEIDAEPGPAGIPSRQIRA